jgi:hypothetical protein
MMSNLSPPPQAPQPMSALDHQGGLSLWLRAGIFALALLAAARPDRWDLSLPSLHAVFLGLFAYSIMGELAACLLAILTPIALFAAAIVLLCFDRATYVPTYRFARAHFRLSALAAFSLAVAIEGAVAGGVIYSACQRSHINENGVPIIRSPGGTLQHPHVFRRSAQSIFGQNALARNRNSPYTRNVMGDGMR